MKRREWVKRSVAAMTAVLCVGMLSACGAPPSQAPSAGGGDASQAANAEFVFRVGHGDDPTDTCWKNRWAIQWGELMQEYSNGRITYEVYPSGQMGDETEMVSSCSLNALEGTIVAATNLANYVPAVNYNNLPFMFADCEEARDIGSRMKDFVMDKSVEQGNVRTAISYSIPRQLSTKKPVASLADIKGMKIRVPSTDSMIKCYEAWGATPVVVSWAETYTALQQGVAEAQDNPIQLLLDAKLTEVQDYVIDTDYLIQCNCFVVSSDWYNSLPEDLQAAVDQATEEVVQYTYDMVDEELPQLIEDLEAAGMEFMGYPEDIEEWKSAARATWEGDFETIGAGDAALGEEIMAAIEEAKE